MINSFMNKLSFTVVIQNKYNLQLLKVNIEIQHVYNMLSLLYIILERTLKNLQFEMFEMAFFPRTFISCGLTLWSSNNPQGFFHNCFQRPQQGY